MRPRRILKRKRAVKLCEIQKTQRLLEILFGFAGEAHDDVGSDADGAARSPDQDDFFEILFPRVRALHGAQYARGARLHRKVHVIAERWRGIDGLDVNTAELRSLRRQ